MNRYYIGFDIGTDSVHTVVMDQDLNIIYTPESLLHFGNPVEALMDIYEELLERYEYDDIITTAFTGSMGEFLSKKLGTPFFHDTLTIPNGVSHIVPDVTYIFHIGAKDPYYFEKEIINTASGQLSFAPDHGTGTKCGGGSGILITKQCRRFFENEFKIKLGDSRKENRALLQDRLFKTFKRAEEEISKSDKDISVGGRCGVVVQSDMIHLQNRGEQINNILDGMYQRVVKNYRSDVLKTRRFDKNKKAVVTGGVFASKHLVKFLQDELDLNLEVPEYFQIVGAIGAVLKAKNNNEKFYPDELVSLAKSEKDIIKTAPPLYKAVDKIKIYEEDEVIAEEEDLVIYNIDKNKKTDVLIGIDGGSTTTKAIVANAETLELIAEICLYTNGKPLQTSQEMFRQIRKYIGENIEIKGVAYTGSSGAFYQKLFTENSKNPEISCVDIVKDEITCHAFGVKHYNSSVDTIFELGGQDAKFTLFNKDGTVKKSKMNLSCMAGTGQTMQNMVEMVGLDLKTTFHDLALKAESTPIVDDTCGVFTEAGIAKLIALGFPRDEIAAAIVYGFMGGYVNKFIGNETFGEFASAQGGPFNGKACLAALAHHTGMEIHAFPHRQLFGALGAVIAIHHEINKFRELGILHETKFRGLDLADAEFQKNIENCSSIVDDTCGVKDCMLQVYEIAGDVIYSGGACPKGNTGLSVKKAPNYTESYKRVMNKYLDGMTIDLDENTDLERILIPRSLTFLNEKGVFYVALFKKLGFEIILSPESNDYIADQGINYSHSETCFPVKLAHGHAAYLKEHMREGKDKMLLVNAIGAENKKFCPYIAGDGFLTKDALHISNEHVLLPVIHFNDPKHKLDKAIFKDLKRVFGNRFTLLEVSNAINFAENENNKFLHEIYEMGDKFVKAVKKKGEKIFVGIGRGYTIFDDMASSKIHELFAINGLHFIPQFFLKNSGHDLEQIAENMYWYQGRSIINYNLDVAMDQDMFPVRETNFNCGTDSILLYHEEYIMNLAEKPHLVLQTDGHSSNAQFGTRTLANYEVVKNHAHKKVELDDFKREINDTRVTDKIIGIPYMGENSYIISAAFRALGYESEVLPTYTKSSNELAKKYVTSNACIPLSFQVGDCFAWIHDLEKRGIDPNKRAAILQPMAKGPCRFGQYHVIMRKFLIESGYDNVSILNPDSEKDYGNIPIPKNDVSKLIRHYFKGTFCNDVLQDALLRTRPYEKENGLAKKVYNELHSELCRLVESFAKTKSLVKFMEKAVGEFKEVIDPRIERKPIVIVNGEIFVRSHPKANQHSIDLLEKYGLETRLASLSQWLEYTNKISIKLYRKANNWKGFFTTTLKKKYMSTRSEKFYEPFRELLKGRKPHDTEHVMDYIQDELIYDKLITGESPLSIGEAQMFAKGKLPEICGIYHVGPFGCMHETAATSQIQSLAQQHRLKVQSVNEKLIPYMDAVFGDSELPNLEAEIAAFAEKCYLKMEISSQN